MCWKEKKWGEVCIFGKGASILRLAQPGGEKALGVPGLAQAGAGSVPFF